MFCFSSLSLNVLIKLGLNILLCDSGTCPVCPRSCALSPLVASVITGRWSGVASSPLVSPTKASAAKARTRTASLATMTNPGASCVPNLDTRPGTTRWTKKSQVCLEPHGLACISIILVIRCPSMQSQKTWSSSTGSKPSSPSHYMPGLESEPLYGCAHRRSPRSCTLENNIKLKHNISWANTRTSQCNLNIYEFLP